MSSTSAFLNPSDFVQFAKCIEFCEVRSEAKHNEGKHITVTVSCAFEGIVVCKPCRPHSAVKIVCCDDKRPKKFSLNL